MGEIALNDLAYVIAAAAYSDLDDPHAVFGLLEDLEIDEDAVVDLWKVRDSLSTFLAIVKSLRTTIDERIAERLGPDGAIRVGDNVVRIGKTRRLVCEDGEGLVRFLFDSLLDKDIPPDKAWAMALSCVRMEPRSTGIKAIADETNAFGMDDVLGVYVFYQESGEKKLQVVPLEKAPKKLARLPDLLETDLDAGPERTE